MLMQYALSVDRASFADFNRHPLLPSVLLRRIESSDPSLTSVTISRSTNGLSDKSDKDASKYIGPRLVAGLADALLLNTCITSLNLAGNKLGSAGLKLKLRRWRRKG